MNGKQKCRILKQIRQEIARENDIDLVIAECTHRGACRGTCPRCEAEVRYLERELEKRRQLHRRIALAGISAGVTLALSGCQAIEAALDAISPSPTPEAEIEDLSGYVPCDTTVVPDDAFVLEGEVPMPDMIETDEAG